MNLTVKEIAEATNGVISGMGNVFGVGEHITRQDMAVMISNALTKSGAELKSDDVSFNDSYSISDYAKEAVSKLVNTGIMTEVGNGNFKPKGKITRANAVKFIYLAVKQI